MRVKSEKSRRDKLKNVQRDIDWYESQPNLEAQQALFRDELQARYARQCELTGTAYGERVLVPRFLGVFESTHHYYERARAAFGPQALRYHDHVRYRLDLQERRKIEGAQLKPRPASGKGRPEDALDEKLYLDEHRIAALKR